MLDFLKEINRKLVVIALVLITVSAFGQGNSVKFVTKIERNEKPCGGANLTVLQNGQQFKTFVTNDDGKVDIDLPGGYKYAIVVTKPQLCAKKFEISTMNLPPTGKYVFQIESISLFELQPGIDYSVLKKTLVKANFNPNSNSIEYDEDYINQMLSELDKLKELEREAQEKERQKEAQYKEAIKEADKAFKKKEYESALANYKTAMDLKPEENYPKEQYDLVKKMMADEAASAKAAAEAKAKAEAEAKAKAEAEAKAKAEAERLAKEKAEAEAKAKAEAEAKAKAEADAKAKAEADAKAKAEAERLAKEKAEAEAKAKAEAEAKAKAEAEAKAKADAEAKAKAEADAKAKAEADAKAKAEAERLAKEKAEAEAKAKAEADAKAKAEAEAKAKAEAEAKAKAEADAKAKAEADAKAKAEADAKAKADAEAKAKAEAERLAKEKAETKAKAEAEAKAKAEADKAGVEKAYADAIKKADDEFNKKDWQLAKNYYQEALAIKPASAYPKQRLAIIEDNIKKDADAKAKAEAEAFAKKKAEEDAAKAKADAEAKAKAEIDAKADADAKAKAALEAAAKKKAEAEALLKKYNDKIAEADNFFKAKKYDEALVSYNEAIAIKSDENYPKDKIKEIEELKKKKGDANTTIKPVLGQKTNTVEPVKEKPKVDPLADYKRFIKYADDYFNQGNFKDAKTNYQKALLEKSGDAYAKIRMIECEKKLNSDENQKFDEAKKELLSKYPPGITEETITGNGVTILQRVVVKSDNVWVYQKKMFAWGGISYFRDKTPITESIFEQETN